MPNYRPAIRTTGTTRPSSAQRASAAASQEIRSRRQGGASPLVPESVANQQAAVVASANQIASTDSISQPAMEPSECGDGPGETTHVVCQSRVLRDESNFIQNVGQFYNQKDISDVIIKIGTQTYYGHKFVLAKSSEVFRTMLYNKNWTQAGLPEIVLEETEECQKNFDTFLRFLYTAEVNISVDSAVGILCLADKYSVESLKNLCTQYMVEHTRSPLVKNALSWYSWSKALHMEELIHQCSKTIAWNAENLLNSPEWLNMDLEFVCDMLQNGDLVISSEHSLFLALEQWLSDDHHVEHYTEYAQQLLPLIRFPQMQVPQLYAVETSEISQNEELRPLLDGLINKAYRFRSLCPHQHEIDVSFTEDFYLPRNYLDLAVDTVRMQNSLRFGIQVDVRTYVGPVPSMSRDGDWKISYRKTNDTWTLQLYCHDSALVGGEARIQAALIITNQEDRVVQVDESEATLCSRGNHLTMSIGVTNQDVCKSMSVLIKPLPK